MDANSPEFQDASQAAAEKIRDFILEVSQSPGQTARTGLTGALAAVAELSIQTRPKNMAELDALSAGVYTMNLYGVQYLDGHGIDAEKVTN